MKVGSMAISIADIALLCIAVVVVLAYANGWG
jgi:hypothetical protein